MAGADDSKVSAESQELSSSSEYYAVVTAERMLHSFLLKYHSHAWNKLDTDFPNYYLTARLARDGFDPSRIYEWR